MAEEIVGNDTPVTEDLGPQGSITYVHNIGTLTLTLPSGKVALIRCDVEDGPRSIDEVEREPEPEPEAPVLKGKLPDDFPGKSALEAADIRTYKQLRDRLATGEHITGIGDVTQGQIDEALAASGGGEEEEE